MQASLHIGILMHKNFIETSPRFTANNVCTIIKLKLKINFKIIKIKLKLNTKGGGGAEHVEQICYLMRKAEVRVSV